MKRRILGFTLIAIVIAATACGGPPRRVQFEPGEDIVPACGSEAQHLDRAAWNAWQRELRELGTEIGAEAYDWPIVVDKLRWDVRYLADGEGCTIQPEYGDKSYDIICHDLQGESQKQRERLVKAVRTHLPKMKSLSHRLRDCTSSVIIFESEAASAAQGGAGQCEYRRAKAASGEAPPTLAYTAGCSFQNQGVCETGCARGDARACGVLASSFMGKDPAKASEFYGKACAAHLSTKPIDAETASTPCMMALSDALKMKDDAAKIKGASELLDRICDAMPTASACVSFSLSYKNQTFSLERAKRVASVLFETSDPKAHKASLLDEEAPFYDRDRARKLAPVLAERCKADIGKCYDYPMLLRPAAPHFDAAVAKEVVALAEPLCQNQNDGVSCGVLIAAYKRKGFLNQPSKALEIATRMCDAAPADSCYQLTDCYRSGECGVPADPAKRRQTNAKQCAALMAKYPNADFHDNAICKDGRGESPTE